MRKFPTTFRRISIGGTINEEPARSDIQPMDFDGYMTGFKQSITNQDINDIIKLENGRLKPKTDNRWGTMLDAILNYNTLNKQGLLHPMESQLFHYMYELFMSNEINDLSDRQLEPYFQITRNMRNTVNLNNLETPRIEGYFETDRLNLNKDMVEEEKAERDRNTDSAQRNLNSSIPETRTIDEEEFAV